MENIPNFDDIMKFTGEFCDQYVNNSAKKDQKKKHFDSCCGCADKDQNAASIIESIALMETALAHILNAEGEKLQKAIKLACNTDDLLAVNSSVQALLIHITFLEQVLYAKLDKACSGCERLL